MRCDGGRWGMVCEKNVQGYFFFRCVVVWDGVELLLTLIPTPRTFAYNFTTCKEPVPLESALNQGENKQKNKAKVSLVGRRGVIRGLMSSVPETVGWHVDIPDAGPRKFVSDSLMKCQVCQEPRLCVGIATHEAFACTELLSVEVLLDSWLAHDAGVPIVPVGRQLMWPW